MHDPDVYILDETTSGLDPLMKQFFIDLVLRKKKEGKTILMSSHSFEEVEKTCDRIAMITDGRIAVVEDIEVLKKQRRKIFVVTVESQEMGASLLQAFDEVHSINETVYEVAVVGDFQHFFEQLKKIKIVDLDVKTQRLEDIFMQYYGKRKG